MDASVVLTANMGLIVSNPPALNMRISPTGNHRDGKLDVCILAPPTPPPGGGWPWRITRRRLGGHDRMIYLQAREVTVESDPPVFTETDGEPLGETPLRVRSVPGGIDVLVRR